MTPPTPRTHPYYRLVTVAVVTFLAGLGFYGSLTDSASLVLLFLAPVALWEGLRWIGL